MLDSPHINSQQAAFDPIRRPLEEASHVPGTIYHSEDVLRQEKERIFGKEWLCVGRAEEIANPGDYMTVRVVGEPILLTRNRDGQVNAFANLCLHRGVEIVSGSGSAKFFSCPYHAWTYDLDGRLVGASFMRESREFDAAGCRLKTLGLGEWGGWLFVNLSADAPPFAEAASEFTADLDFLRMEDCRIGSKIVVDVEANWKFVVENLMDVYHARTLHANSFGKHRGSPEKYPFHLRKNGGTCTVYEAAPMTPDGKTLFRRMPAIADRPDNFAISAHLAPNMQVIARSDNVHPLVMWPTSATSTRTIVYNLFPKEFVDEYSDFAERADVYDKYIRLVLDEDAGMLVSMQQAMRSSNYVPGRLSTLEKGIHHVLNDYLRKMFDPA